MRDTPLPSGLPPMSMREERRIKQRIRAQIKPLSVATLDQAKNFYMAVGQGISHWSGMEGRVVQVVAKLLITTEPKAGLVMYNIMNLHSWITIVDDLFSLDKTYPKSAKKWGTIAELLKKEIDNRVRLAHHSISQEDVDPGEELRMIQAFLRPHKLDLRRKWAKAKPLTMREIVDFTGRVNDIHDKLIDLLKLMKKRKSSR
jgi:hypothetical protein